MGLTTDRNDPGLKQVRPDGQQEAYLVLSEEERQKGYVRPFRDKYIHLLCGTVTKMGFAISETYARNPKFYGGTFCVGCQQHFPLRDYRTEKLKTTDGWAFLWEPDGEPVGSNAEEALAWNTKQLIAKIPEMKRRRLERIEAARRELANALTASYWDVYTCCECSAEYISEVGSAIHDPVYCSKCREKYYK